LLKTFIQICSDNFSEQKSLRSIAIISGILFLSFLDNLPLKDWDEGTYALIAREIVRTGDWVYLKLPGAPFLMKPPLGLWLIAASYTVGGISEFTTRFPFACLTALSVPTLYLISRQLFNRHIPALYSTLVYITLLPIARHGRFAMLDGISITFFLISLFCLLKARTQPVWSIGIGMMLGLVVLTKGILGLVFGFIIGLLIVAFRQFNLLTSIYLWLGIIIGALPATVWYAAQFQNYGNTFFQVHFQSQTFDRFSQAIEGHPGPIWFYALDILEYAFPWWLFLGSGLIWAWHCRTQIWSQFALITGGVYFIIVSVMQTKLPWYGLPVYPFIAIVIGADLAEIWEFKQPIYTRFRWGMLVFVSAVGSLGCGYFAIVEQSWSLVIMSLALAGSTGGAAWLIKRRDRLFIPTLFVGIYLVFFAFMSSQSWAWEINNAFLVKPVAQLISSHVSRGSMIYTSWPNERPSLDFYSDTRVIPTKIEDIPQQLAQHQFVLIDRASRDKLSPSSYKILGSADRFYLIHRDGKSAQKLGG
jgi:4-amino-4-deoxy-L-arabinose transferase-like glycosyltransferase